ncbi:MAG TPA: hypothetical protein ENK55_02060 [Actinobacteria bacterium]|nr:hypothetical protein [Actinomycetota bacterium]
MSSERTRRVVGSHRLLRIAFVASGTFAGVAAAWAAIVALRGGAWWGPLHAFVIGAVLASISGATQMFTITWANAPPPPRWMPIGQGSALVAGTIAVLVGVTASVPSLVWVGGSTIVASLVLLAASLVHVIRRSLLRRFDLSLRFYLLALACGIVGVTLGTLLGTGVADLGVVRLVHLHLNLVGLVGFTIVGTLPTLLPTFAHHRMVSGREAVAAWWGCVAAAGFIVAGLVGPVRLVGAGAVVAGTSGAVVLGGIVGRLGRRALKETLPYLQVTSGVVWLVAWTFADGIGLLRGVPTGRFAPWTAAAVIAGVGQVLAGSIAYLAPVVLGPPIGDNLRRMGRSPALPWTAANVAGLALVCGFPVVAAAVGAVWLGDLARRVVGLRRPTRVVR